MKHIHRIKGRTLEHFLRKLLTNKVVICLRKMQGTFLSTKVQSLPTLQTVTNMSTNLELDIEFLNQIKIAQFMLARIKW